MCDLVRKKYDKKSHNPSRVRQVIREKEQQLAQTVDKKINQAIAHLKKLQQQVKRNYGQILSQNVEVVEQNQTNLLRQSRKGQALSQALERAADHGRIQDIVSTAKLIDESFGGLNKDMERYEEIKRKCQVKRENFAGHAAKGARDLADQVEIQVGAIMDCLGIKSKTRDDFESQHSQTSRYEEDSINASLCLMDVPMRTEDLHSKRTSSKPTLQTTYKTFLNPQILKRTQTMAESLLTPQNQGALNKSGKQSRLIEDSMEKLSMKSFMRHEHTPTPNIDNTELCEEKPNIIAEQQNLTYNIDSESSHQKHKKQRAFGREITSAKINFYSAVANEHNANDVPQLQDIARTIKMQKIKIKQVNEQPPQKCLSSKYFNRGANNQEVSKRIKIRQREDQENLQY